MYLSLHSQAVLFRLGDDTDLDNAKVAREEPFIRTFRVKVFCWLAVKMQYDLNTLTLNKIRTMMSKNHLINTLLTPRGVGRSQGNCKMLSNFLVCQNKQQFRNYRFSKTPKWNSGSPKCTGGACVKFTLRLE